MVNTYFRLQRYYNLKKWRNETNTHGCFNLISNKSNKAWLSTVNDQTFLKRTLNFNIIANNQIFAPHERIFTECKRYFELK